MAEVEQIRGPIINSSRLENDVTYQIDPGLPWGKGICSATVISDDPTGTLSGTLLFELGGYTGEIVLSEGQRFLGLDGPAMVLMTPTGLNPTEKFLIKFLY